MIQANKGHKKKHLSAPSMYSNFPQMDGGKGMGGAVGGSGVEELAEGGGGSVPSGGGRKKKKKHKSGEDMTASAKASGGVGEEELVDPALPMLSDNQGVDWLFIQSLCS